MKKFMICLVFVLLLVGFANAQTKSVTGTVVSVDRGMYKWETITVKVGNKEYTVYTFCGLSASYCSPKIVGNVSEVGRNVQIFYTKIVNGEMRATRIAEVKKTNTSAKQTTSNTCKFCGMWEYYDREAQSTNYLKITTVGAGKFRLIPGYVGVGGQIAWQDSKESGLIINNADGIYLKLVGEKLVGSFVSLNFRATGGSERTYKIACEIKANGKMAYTVTSSGFTEKYEATKK